MSQAASLARAWLMVTRQTLRRLNRGSVRLYPDGRADDAIRSSQFNRPFSGKSTMNKEVKGYLIIAGIVVLTLVVVFRFLPTSIRSLVTGS